jgi:cytochrome b561
MAVADDKARIDGSKAIRWVVSGDESVPSLAAAASARPRALVVLHWLTVLVLLAAASVILARELVSAKPPRAWLLDLHRHLGLCVLLLFALRVGLRLRWGRLPAVATLAWPLRLAAALMHAALYASILLLPLLGWALSNAAGQPVHFFGLALPALVAPDFDLADQLLLWHQNAAWTLLALVVLHVAAALWHHFVRRDAVLRVMWPGRG